MKTDSFAFTSAGGREINEDDVRTGSFPGGYLYVLADGLGGHLHGEVASHCVTDTLTEGPMPDESTNITAWMSERIAAANSRLLELQERGSHGMRSTVAVLVLNGNKAYWAHSGDSRIYCIHRGEIAFITEDHSVAYRKFKSGEISREMIGSDDDQASLLRSLGSPDRFEPETGSAPAPIEPGDAFLLCSDGLWEYVRDEEILIDLFKSADAREWAEYMLSRAMERIDGENDNISLITVMVQ